MTGQDGFDFGRALMAGYHEFAVTLGGLCARCGQHRGAAVHAQAVELPAMPGGKAVARSGDQVTAHVAATTFRDLRPRQKAVYDVLRSIQPATDEQIVDEYRRFQRVAGSDETAERLGIPPQTDSSIRSRRAEMVTAELIVAVDREGRTKAGGVSTRWQVKPR